MRMVFGILMMAYQASTFENAQHGVYVEPVSNEDVDGSRFYVAEKWKNFARRL